MSEDVTSFITGTRIDSHTSPITHKAAMAYSESVQALNRGGELNVEIAVEHFNRTILGIFDALSEVERSVNYDIIDKTQE